MRISQWAMENLHARQLLAVSAALQSLELAGLAQLAGIHPAALSRHLRIAPGRRVLADLCAATELALTPEAWRRSIRKASIDQLLDPPLDLDDLDQLRRAAEIWRAANNLRVEDLGKNAGISRQTMSGILAGSYPPSPAQRERLKRAISEPLA